MVYLMMVSQMRSNDVVFGYKNDYAWAQYLMDKFVSRIGMKWLQSLVNMAQLKKVCLSGKS